MEGNTQMKVIAGVADYQLEQLKKNSPELFKKLIDSGLLVESNGIFYTVPSNNVVGDIRYNIPKKDHGFSNEEVDAVIDSNSIYSEAKEELLNAQRRQVGYGMGKYPEALTADSWDIIETLNHDIEETADSLHYKIMLRQKLTKMLIGRPTDSEVLAKKFEDTIGELTKGSRPL